MQPGAEYEALCEELTEEFLKITNAETGKTAIAEVIRLDKVQYGEFQDEFPDLVVTWKGDTPIQRLTSPRIGTVEGTNLHERSGSHRPYGFVITAGEPFRKGATSEHGHIMDIAPTIQHLLGQSTPPDMDGRVLTHLLASSDTTHVAST